MHLDSVVYHAVEFRSTTLHPEEKSPLTTSADLVTADELIAMSEDGCQFELVRGNIIRIPWAGLQHARLVADVSHHLWNHNKTEDLGEVFARVGYMLESDPDTVRAPDASFISRERLEEFGETDGYWPGAPDLVVEVISPSDKYTDVEAKVSGWLASGARMVIVVNPRRRSVRVHRSPTEVDDLLEGDTLDGGDVVPGWSMQVSGLF